MGYSNESKKTSIIDVLIMMFNILYPISFLGFYLGISSIIGMLYFLITLYYPLLIGIILLNIVIIILKRMSVEKKPIGVNVYSIIMLLIGYSFIMYFISNINVSCSG